MMCFSVIGTQRKVPRSIQTENVKQVCSEFEKETSETLFIQKNRSVFWPGNFLEDCVSQYRVDSEDCIDRLNFICNCSCKLSSFERDAEINPPLAITFTA